MTWLLKKTLLLSVLLSLIPMNVRAQSRLLITSDSEILSVNPLSGNKLQVFTGGGTCIEPAFDQSRNELYWIEGFSRVLKVNLNSMEVSTVRNATSRVFLSMDIDPIGRVLFIGTDSGIITAELDDPSSTGTLRFGGSNYSGLTHVAGSNSLVAWNASASTLELLTNGGTTAGGTLYTGINDVRNLRVDEQRGMLLWALSLSNRIDTAPLSGVGPVTTLYDGADGLPQPLSLAFNDQSGQIVIGTGVNTLLEGSADGTAPLQSLVTPGPTLSRGATFNRATGDVFICDLDRVLSRFDASTASLQGDVLPENYTEVTDVFSSAVRCDGQRIFWGKNEILRGGFLNQSMLISGSLNGDAESLSDEVAEGPITFVDASRIDRSVYYYLEGTQSIVQLEEDGTRTVLVSGIGDIRDFIVDEQNGLLYWTPNTAPGDIMRAPVDGSALPTSVVNMYAGNQQPVGLALNSNGTLYWSDLALLEIRAADISILPANSVVVHTLVDFVATDLEIDDETDTLYWSSTSRGQERVTRGSGLSASVATQETVIEDSGDLFYFSDPDSDGFGLCADSCPADGNKQEPGICGCGSADIDSDGDGTLDCQETCPSDPDKTEPGECGCGNGDLCLCETVSLSASQAALDGGSEQLRRIGIRTLRLPRRRRFQDVCELNPRRRAIRTQLDELYEAIWNLAYLQVPTVITQCPTVPNSSCTEVTFQSALQEIQQSVEDLRNLVTRELNRCKPNSRIRAFNKLRSQLRVVSTTLNEEISAIPSSTTVCS